MEKLRRCEKILEQSLVGYWEWNIKENKVEISSTLQKIVNSSDTNTDAINPTSLIKSLEKYNQLVSSRGTIEYEEEESFLQTDGAIIWTIARISVIEWSDTNEPVVVVGYYVDISNQKKKELSIIKRKNVLKTILHNIPQSVFWVDSNNVFLGCNKSFAEIVGLQEPEMVVGKTHFDFHNLKKEDILAYQADDIAVIKNNKAKLHIVEKTTNASGERIWIDTSKVPLLDESGKPYGVLGIFNDITKQEQMKQELIRTNMLYNTLSKINGLLHTINSKEELFDSICNIIVKVGGFQLAWIGEAVDNIVKSVSYAGSPSTYIENLHIPLYEEPQSLGPTARCIKENKRYICNDFLADNITNPWHVAARESGIKASATFPITYEEVVVGVLGVYANTKNYFTPKEIALLEEVVLTISSGLEKVAKEKREQEWKEDIIKAQEEWERTFNSIPDLIAILDKDHNIVRMNKAMSDRLKINAQCCLGKKCYTIVHGAECPLEKCPHNLLLKDGQVHSMSMFEEKLGGYFTFTTSPILDDDGKLVGSIHIAKDITEQKNAERKIQQQADIIEYSNAFIGIAKYKGKNFVYLNNSVKKAFDIQSDEDITKMHSYDFHTEATNEKMKKVAYTNFEGKRMWVGESEWISKNGKIIPVLQNIMLHNNDNGEPEYISTTAIDISDIKKKEADLKTLTEDLRSLSNHLQFIREEERKMMAKEIHDELGQVLTILKMDAAWIGAHLDSDRNVVMERVVQFKSIADEAVQTSRRLYNSLYPQMLEDIGLVGAIKWHSDTYIKSSNIKVVIQTNIEEGVVFKENHHICLALFRIYQECFTNILRYSKAENATISLNFVNSEICLRIKDNGIGFELDKVDTKLHHGLLGMRERAFALNGTLLIESTVGKGTTTTVSIPVPGLV